MDDREVKTALYEEFARIGKAVSNGKRIELLDLLAQGERSVEALGHASSMGVGNTSAQLQVLRRARLVEARKDGTNVYYRIADDGVTAFLVSLLALASNRLAEVAAVSRDYFDARDALEPISRTELVARAERGDVVILDVRPAEEFEAGHIPGAVSAPLGQLDKVVARLPKAKDIVAYCRGPYCVFAPEAVRLLRKRGFTAHRLEDGMPEWRLAGLPVAVGEA